MDNGPDIRFMNEIEALPSAVVGRIADAMEEAKRLAEDPQIVNAAITLYLLREKQGAVTIRRFLDDLKSVANQPDQKPDLTVVN